MHTIAAMQEIFYALTFDEAGNITNTQAELAALKIKTQQLHAAFRLFKNSSTVFEEAINPLAITLGMSGIELKAKDLPYELLSPFRYIIEKILDQDKRAKEYVDHFNTLLDIDPNLTDASQRLDAWKQTKLAQGWFLHRDYSDTVKKKPSICSKIKNLSI